MLLRQTARDSDDIPPVLSGRLLRAILTGVQYPDGLYDAVIRRIYADREINYVRACIIKGWLVRNRKKEVSMSLDPENRHPAYCLGRLFSVIERLQEVAFFQQTGRNMEHGIRDSYFSAACSTPASVFPRLEKLSSHHRRQLNPGSKHFFDQMIADIKWDQGPTPAILSLADQGIFLLGYYHQWKALRQSKHEKEKEES